MIRLAILISGRGSNMEALLDNVAGGQLQGLCRVEVVLSNRADAPGLTIARERGIETLVLPSAGKRRKSYGRLLVEALAPYRLDYLVLAGFMFVLSAEVIAAYAGKVINIHPADTRFHRGLGGYAWAWEKGLDTTFITVHYVDRGVDTGPVIDRAAVDLRGAASLEEVHRRGLAVEHEFYSHVLKNIFSRG